MTAPDAALLPCPFCGAAGEILETQAGQAAAFCTLYRADCSERGCADMPWEANKADTIAAWNRRAGQSHDAGLLAALTAENERLASIVRGWHWLAVGPDEMGDYLHQRELIKASEPYANPALKAIAAAKGADHDD